MRIDISDKEIVAEPFCVSDIVNNKQLILRILKRKGAPIYGTLYLRPDYTNYTWHYIYDPINKSHLYVIE